MEHIIRKLREAGLNAASQADLEKFIDFLMYQEEQAKIQEMAWDLQTQIPEKAEYLPEDLQAIANQYPRDTKWTTGLLEKAFPFEYKVKVEIINHKLFIMGFPSLQHQEIIGALYSSMTQFVNEKQLGKVILSPFGVKLNNHTLFAPDLLFVSVQRQGILTEKQAEGAPDLVVEVLSPANYKKQREEKAHIYAQSGVLEYWEIRPEPPQISIHSLQSGKYEMYSQAEGTGIVKSSVLEGFVIDIQVIFR